MDILTGTILIILFVMFAVSILFHFGKIDRYRKRKNTYDELFKELIQSKNKQYAAIEFSKRCGIYYKTFFFYQLLSKGINMLCLIMTVFSMITPLSNNLSLISSMVSFICVVIIVYLNPSKRAEQYLYAWRLCDAKLYEIVCNLDKTEYKLYKKINEIPKIIKKAELLLSSDAE